MALDKRKVINYMYDRLSRSLGPQRWWPAETPLEIIVGAILTQNTNWKNVEKAIINLKAKGLLNIESLRGISTKRLASLIKPAGYYNVKAKRLKNFINYLSSTYDGSIKKMFKKDFLHLRSEFLNLNGIGKETADSILLYAGKKPIFVIDAYTKKILQRHHLIEKDTTYSQMQDFFMDNLKKESKTF